MSTINSKNVQVGTSSTANQNFTLYQPASPDGTVRLGVGNSGATTLDAVTVTSAGNVTVAGTTALPAGSASAPALTTTGDTNTGVFFPAADTIAFTTNGTEDMRIDSSGNVGIGTSSPGSKLDVTGPASVTSFTGTTKLGIVTRGSTGATDYSGIDFIGNSQTNPLARVAVLSTGGGSFLSFGTSITYGSGITNTAMTIDPAGKLILAAAGQGIQFADGTTQTTAASTPTTLYAVGTYVIGRPNSVGGSTFAVNSTVAGSSLYAVSAGATMSATGGGMSTPGDGLGMTLASTLVNTGSWRCVSPAGSGPYDPGVGAAGYAGLYVRFA